MMGLTEVNLAYYQDLMAGARLAISEGRLDAYIAETQRQLGGGRGGRTLRPAALWRPAAITPGLGRAAGSKFPSKRAWSTHYSNGRCYFRRISRNVFPER